MSSPYSTPESPSVLWNERTINAAVYIGAIAYGLHISVCFQSVSAVMQSGKANWKWIPFIAISFIMSSVNISCSINFNQLAWIDERNYPGGPLAFIVQQSSRSVNTASIATSVVTLFFADAFLVYRCNALWKRFYVTVSLSIFLAASTVLSILHCIQAARPDAGLWDDATVKISIPYASVSMSLNTLLTVILAWRVLDLRRKLPTTLNQDVKRLADIRTLLIETALPFGVISFIFVIFYGLRSAGANLFVPLLVQLEGIVPELIILRMVKGRAWSLDELRSVAPHTVVFRGNLGCGAHNSDTATGRDDISMVILRDEANQSAGSKLARELV